MATSQSVRSRNTGASQPLFTGVDGNRHSARELTSVAPALMKRGCSNHRARSNGIPARTASTSLAPRNRRAPTPTPSNALVSVLSETSSADSESARVAASTVRVNAGRSRRVRIQWAFSATLSASARPSPSHASRTSVTRRTRITNCTGVLSVWHRRVNAVSAVR